MKKLSEVRVGDTVHRCFGNEKIPVMSLIVSSITNEKIICEDYEFSVKNGLEIDEYLNWGELGSGSYIVAE